MWEGADEFCDGDDQVEMGDATVFQNSSGWNSFTICCHQLSFEITFIYLKNIAVLGEQIWIIFTLDFDKLRWKMNASTAWEYTIKARRPPPPPRD